MVWVGVSLENDREMTDKNDWLDEPFRFEVYGGRYPNH